MASLLLLLLSAVAAQRLGDVTRRDAGDTFTLTSGSCEAAECAEHGAGRSGVTGAAGAAGAECACACPQRAPLFREDRELCVDDLPGELFVTLILAT
ncbi:unnamed protein product [Plutella xylostella]|uniref:(diamondback moth) hypothetical protein n=1 Tax=Plutella xylostella TaxID=51655 RepID=A0A8S4F6M1_PLUXY|nr:unnamed protein product [Plutella xylostella]